MARYFGATSQLALISNLRNQDIIRTPVVIRALTQVDRSNFVIGGDPYQDSPQPIGLGQTISAPHMHGYCLESLSDVIMNQDAHILDVGVGSGYLSTAMARMNPNAAIYGIDVYQSLVKLAETNIRKQDGDLLDTNRIMLSVGNGWLGHPSGAPYDAIHVGAAASKLPQELLRQLKVGGRLVIPVGDEDQQELVAVDRVSDRASSWANMQGLIDEQDFRTYSLMKVRYVRLIPPKSPPPRDNEF